MTRSSYFTLGWNASKAGKAEDTNPFVPKKGIYEEEEVKSARAEWWTDGFHAANRKDIKKLEYHKEEADDDDTDGDGT